MRLQVGLTMLIGGAGMIAGCSPQLDAPGATPMVSQAQRGSEDHVGQPTEPDQPAEAKIPALKATKGPCREPDGRIRLGCLPAGTVLPRDAVTTTQTAPPKR